VIAAIGVVLLSLPIALSHSYLLLSTDNASREYVTTRDDNLVIVTKAVKTHYFENGEKLVKNYTSGMVQTWNKFCFTGGVLEMSIKLPGTANSGGKIW
jgi:beta-glucanase (GH16 family)